MMTDDEIIAVIQAHKEGKEIQCRRTSGSSREWRAAYPAWRFNSFEYRVKPEPLVCWVVKYSDGTIAYPAFKEEGDAAQVASSAQGVVVKMVEADEND